MKVYNATNVYEAAVKRMVDVYNAGHRVIVAFSAGKDSTAAMEITIEAATLTGRLPVEVWMQDEEIMYPGTYEYAERVANRKEVLFHWLVCGEPGLNVFNRKDPYYWVFDWLLKPEQWMREPPAISRRTTEQDIYNVVNPEAFPPPEGKMLAVTMGVRASESRKRNIIIHRSGGAISGMAKLKGSKIDRSNEIHVRPIYDWTTKDVWLAVKEKNWDYNEAYNVMTRFAIPRDRQRIAPVTMTPHGIPLLQMASKAWPDWFDRLAIRLPGVRLAAMYGRQVLRPIRHQNETWEQAYQRICIDEAPAWISKRAEQYREIAVTRHGKHSSEPIMEIAPCPTCANGKMSWERMTNHMYFGDPFLLETDEQALGYLEPEDMRPGTGTWSGKPVF